jgi:septum formation protein
MTARRKPGEPSLILASASPRRRELLRELGLAFTVAPSGLDEAPWPNEAPASYALRNAGDKARAVVRDRRLHGAFRVLAADTIVVLGREILEKPRDAAHARAMLRRLSGVEHEVITGLCLLEQSTAGRRERGEAVRTAVRFRRLAAREIAAYVAGGEPMDKAGAYAIQGGAAAFVAQIRGSYTNVVGLPVETLLAWRVVRAKTRREPRIKPEPRSRKREANHG